MEVNNPLDIQDADNIDFNTEVLNESSDESSDGNESNNETHNERETSTTNEDEDEDSDKGEDEDKDEDNKTNNLVEPNEMALDEPGFFYNLLHILDDIYVYGRTVIENNYFNLSDNVDFNLVYPNIYIGNYSTSTNLELLQGLGITHIITVLPTFNPPFPDKFTYLHVQAYDDEIQNLEPFFQQTNKFISDALTQRGKLLIHCMVGRSRSVSVLIAFLIHVIKGHFNQSLVDTTSSNDVSNEIEYNKFIGKHIVKETKVITDSVASIRYVNETPGNNDLMLQNNEEISRVEYLQPEFGNKFRKFINYKKDLMLEDIRKLLETYKTDKSNDLYVDILAYVKKHRVIACPNVYFEKQLRNLLNLDK
jgi:hypothetical protein